MNYNEHIRQEFEHQLGKLRARQFALMGIDVTAEEANKLICNAKPEVDYKWMKH